MNFWEGQEILGANMYCIIIQKNLKVNIQLKPELFLLGLMDQQLERKYGILFLYMITAARLLCAQRWKVAQIPTVEELNLILGFDD